MLVKHHKNKNDRIAMHNPPVDLIAMYNPPVDLKGAIPKNMILQDRGRPHGNITKR